MLSALPPGSTCIGSASWEGVAHRIGREMDAVFRYATVWEDGVKVVEGGVSRIFVEVSVARNVGISGGWRVEMIDDDGGVDIAVFYGRDAEPDAKAYAAWRYLGSLNATDGPPEPATPSACPSYAPAASPPSTGRISGEGGVS